MNFILLRAGPKASAIDDKLLTSPQDDKSLEKVLIKSKPLPKEIDYPYTGGIASIKKRWHIKILLLSQI